MSQESPVEDALTPEELSELLVEVEGTTPEAIERGATALKIAPSEEATVIDEERLHARLYTSDSLKSRVEIVSLGRF